MTNAEVVGDSIDRLAAVEMRTVNPQRGVVTPLFEASRKKIGSPMTMTVASELTEKVSQNDYVLIITGMGTPPSLPKGESDGPPGAASIARALDIGLGARPVFLADEHHFDPIIASSEALGISVMDHEYRKETIHGAEIQTFPVDENEAFAASKDILDKYDPVAIIAVERVGPNEKGVKHTMGGYSISGTSQLHKLVEYAREDGVLTIGIADNGNEIGCGLITEEVKKVQPYGADCNCPCGGGIAAVTNTDYLIFSSISNWGAYGLSACLSFLLEDIDVMQDAYLERRMLEKCADAGGLDGDFSLQIPSADLVSVDGHQAMVTLMRETVSLALRTREEVFSENQ